MKAKTMKRAMRRKMLQKKLKQGELTKLLRQREQQQLKQSERWSNLARLKAFADEHSLRCMDFTAREMRCIVTANEVKFQAILRSIAVRLAKAK